MRQPKIDVGAARTSVMPGWDLRTPLRLQVADRATKPFAVSRHGAHDDSGRGLRESFSAAVCQPASAAHAADGDRLAGIRTVSSGAVPPGLCPT
jgi:hypothetical protein